MYRSIVWKSYGENSILPRYNSLLTWSWFRLARSVYSLGFRSAKTWKNEGCMSFSPSFTPNILIRIRHNAEEPIPLVSLSRGVSLGTITWQYIIARVVYYIQCGTTTRRGGGVCVCGSEQEKNNYWYISLYRPRVGRKLIVHCGHLTYWYRQATQSLLLYFIQPSHKLILFRARKEKK